MTQDVVIRARKFINNKLLNRKQFLCDVFHQDCDSFSKAVVVKAVSQKFKVPENTVVVDGLKTKFGGGKSQAFVMIYETLDLLKKVEPKYRLLRLGLIEEGKSSKGQRVVKKKEKNRNKKYRGLARVDPSRRKKRKNN